MCQVSYLLMYGELPSAPELGRWEEAVMRHSGIPAAVEQVRAAPSPCPACVTPLHAESEDARAPS